MKQIKPIFTASLALIVFIGITANAIAGCNKVTDDAGRWRDPLDPADRIADMCAKGITFHQAETGKMALEGMNANDCKDLFAYAKGQQSWHDDWFLWSEIYCDFGMKMFIK